MIVRRLRRGLIAFEAYDYYAEFGRRYNYVGVIDREAINYRSHINRDSDFYSAGW